MHTATEGCLLAFFTVVASCSNLSTLLFGCKISARRAKKQVITCIFLSRSLPPFCAIEHTCTKKEAERLGNSKKMSNFAPKIKIQDKDMALQCGIVGLPNVGKSTLFNCLSNAKAQAANFPFCTIEPNVGVTPQAGRAGTPGTYRPHHRGDCGYRRPRKRCQQG